MAETSYRLEEEIPLNSNAQPLNRLLNFSRNKEKAAYELKGILKGLTADEKINDLELLFLDLWLKEQEHLKDDGDVIDLLDLIGDILADGMISENELKELHSLANDIAEYKEADLAGYESEINELVNLLAGMAADGVLNDKEIYELLKWLLDHPDVKAEWPVNIITENLHHALEDGIVTEEEKLHLLDVMKKITGVCFEESGAHTGWPQIFLKKM